MIRLTILIVASIGLFISLRMLSVLIAFLFGIGASAPSEKYTPYVLIPVFIFQLVISFILYKKGIFIKKNFQLVIIVITLLILFVLGQFGIIPV